MSIESPRAPETLDPPDRRRQLLARLRELDARLRDIEAELVSHDSPDWEERATEREHDEVLGALGDDGLAEIRQIRAALGRLTNGTYGDCTICGAPINEARLNVLPATPFCALCAS